MRRSYRHVAELGLTEAEIEQLVHSRDEGCQTPLVGPQLAAVLCRASTRACPFVRSPPGLEVADDLGGESGIAQQLVDKCGEDVLPGDAGDSEAVGGLSLPDVEGSVLAG